MLKNSLKLSIVVAIAWLAMGPAFAAHAADWGSLKGRFIVDGTPAKLTPLVVNKDQYCMDKKPVNEEIVLGKDNALVNAVVSLRLNPGEKTDIHPDYEAKFKEPVVLDNNGCQFHPHITLARVGQDLIIKNSDPPPVGHNTNIALFAFNQTIASTSETKIKVSKDAPLPMPIVCNIHGWMKGYILPQTHPYMAVSGDDGTFEIKNLPAGKHTFQFWHEAEGYLKNLKLKGGMTERHGRIDLTIPAGQTLDLGDIKVAASGLR